MGYYQLPKIIGKDNKPPFGARVNWHHPLSQGAKLILLMNESAGNILYDNVYGYNFPLQSGLSWNQKFLYGDSDHLLNYCSSGLRSTDFAFSDFSVTFRIKPNYIANYNQIIRSGDNWTRFTAHSDSSGGIYIGTDISTRFVPADTGTVYSLNSWVVWNYVYSSGNGYFYVNGKLQCGPKAQNASPSWFNFFIGDAGSSNSIAGYVDFLYVHGRALTSQEISSLYANPYQMFLPSVWDAYFVPAAAPPPTGGKSIFGYDSIFHAGGIIQT